MTLEAEFWQGLKEIARRRRMTVSELVGFIDSQRQHNNLSSALRLFVLRFYRNQIPDPAELEGVTPPSAAPSDDEVVFDAAQGEGGHL